ncbi:MAG TPA: outer membrane beta-barrel protein [Povalibacter sp.]
MKLAGMALAVVGAVGFAAPALAVDSEFQISPRAGRGELQLDQFRGVNDGLAEVDTIGLGVSFGFLTPIGVLLEAGTESYGNFDLFNADDEFVLRQYYAALGYQFELGDGWRLTPKVGRGKWKLTSEEGWLIHDDDVDTTVDRGYENFWELGVGKRVNDVMTLGASVRSGDYDFGEAGSVSFVMTFGF